MPEYPEYPEYPEPSVITLDDYRPHVVIQGSDMVSYVIPEALIEDIASGRMGITEVKGWKPLLRGIVKEWLEIQRGDST